MPNKNSLIHIPDEVNVKFDFLSSLYLGLAILAGLFSAGIGVVFAIKVFLKDDLKDE